MKRIRRIAALLLSFMMLFPTQGMTALADMEETIVSETQVETLAADGDSSETQAEERIEETLPLEELDPGQDTEESAHIQETLPLEPLEDTGSLSGIAAIYWNPGGSLPADQSAAATASNADPVATSSNMEGAAGTDKKFVAKGSDRADGYTPDHPVKSLETALKQADRLAEENGLDKSDITIYAMNPMEIPDGRMYVLNAGNIRIASWPGRTYNDDTIFYLNGGQLTLMNVVLETGRESVDPEDAKLVHVKGGAVQLGRGVTVDGRIVMDYRKGREQTEWEKASASNAATPSDTSSANTLFADETGGKSSASSSNWTESGQSGAGFDIDSYILNTEEEEWELLEDRSSASTWREPIIELIDGFDGLSEGYLLELRSDDDRDSVTLAKTLYADEATEEEFAGFFRLADTVSLDWELRPLSERAATVRDTGAEELKKYYRSASLLSEDEGAAGTDGVTDEGELSVSENVMTVKMLAASRAGEDVVYWNPGPAFEGYPAGSDESNDGTTAEYPLKTLKKAMGTGKTIVAIQPLDLGSEDVKAYLGFDPEGNGAWKLPTSDQVTFRVFSTKPGPVFLVSNGAHLIMENIELEGIMRNGALSEYKAIEVAEGGDLTIGKNVQAQTGYIELRASEKLKDHPVHADSVDRVSVKLFFSGINDDATYRYTDVVVPSDNLLGERGTNENERQQLGDTLSKCYGLIKSNTQGGEGKYSWELRRDTAEDDSQANPQNLELYTNVDPVGVYLDGINGNDGNAGTSYWLAVKTWDKAHEIWKKQMDAHKASGKAVESYPNKIYICGTVTLDSGTHTWKLEPYIIDKDNNEITSEVLSYYDTSASTGGKAARLEAIKTLVKVTGEAKLTLEDINFYNNSDLSASRTILVSGSGASVTLTGTTNLSGVLRSTDPAQNKAATKGTHIEAEKGGSVTLDGSWMGAVESRQQGITASGAGTTVSMKGGRIQNNDVYDPNVKNDSQKRGAGVSLSDGATMVMDGGSIHANKTFSHGGGVYLEGDGTTFTMKRGFISYNTVASADAYASYAKPVYGVGIYAGPGTNVQIGEDNNPGQRARVNYNVGYLVAGGGIYTEGNLVVKQNAEISNNRADVSFGGKDTGEDKLVKGVGICVTSEGSLQMAGATVSGNQVYNPNTASKNYEHGQGAGIYISGKGASLIESSTIKDNRTGRYAGDGKRSLGGGIYFGGTGTLDINDSTIDSNRAGAGGGIGVYLSEGGRLTLKDCHIDKNIATFKSTTEENLNSGNGNGGGIWFSGSSNGTMIMKGGTVSENKASGFSGAIRIESGTFQISGSEGSPVVITKNQPVGISVNTFSVLSGDNVQISGNDYGGIRSWLSSKVYLRSSQITGNLSSGVDNRGGELYFEDVKIEDNKSTDTWSDGGGGIYQTGQESKLYWSETVEGGSSLKNNFASNGGGGMVCNGGAAFLDFHNEIKNQTDGKGHNIYIKGQGEVHLFDGTLKQPADPGKGICNVYVDSNSAQSKSGRGLVLDGAKVKIEKKQGGSPEAIYLNTVNGYVRLLSAFPDNISGAMPIDVNTSSYNIGNVVVSPENKSEITLYRPNVDSPGKTAYPKEYSPLKDVTINQQYVSGGMIPEGLSLGMKTDNTNKELKSLALIGEGIYLDGTGGKNSNSGLSPEDPVATFAQAESLLRAAIKKRHDEEQSLDSAARKGFAPYIYICGTVRIDQDEHWKLEYDDQFFTDNNQAYLQNSADQSSDKRKAQVRRYTDFADSPMIQVTGQATLTLEKIIVNGMKDALTPTNLNESSPIIKIESDAEVSLSGYTQLRNNYHSGILCEGKLILDGKEGERNRQLEDIDGYAVSLEGGTSTGGPSLEMKGYSQIVVQSKSDNKSAGELGGVAVKAYNGSIKMSEHSSIKSEPTGDTGESGISINGTASNTKIEMQNAQIIATRGIYSGSSAEIYMRGTSRIEGFGRGYGVSFEGNGSGKMEMSDTSTITGSRTGILIQRNNVIVTLKDNANISKTTQLGMSINADYIQRDVQINLDGNSHISDAGSAGIYVAQTKDPVTNNRQWEVYLKETAYISGIGNRSEANGYYGNGIDASGNGLIALATCAHISNNIGYGIAVKGEHNGNVEVELVGGSEIRENRDGGVGYYQKAEVSKIPLTMNVRDKASVKNNEEDQIVIDEKSQVTLAGDASVLRGTLGGPTAISAKGQVEMDGTVTVDGLIALKTATMPIKLKTKITDKTYKLNLTDGFIGKPVVTPGISQLDASDYLKNFLKEDTADTSNAVKGKKLVAESPNIILEDENDVYLSGTGSNNNSGRSPNEPVLTFARAKELLIEEQHTEGANIYICGDTVNVTNSEEWSFGNGGVVTNKISGATWTPLVKRYDTFNKQMVSVSSNGSLTLRNITLDGNKEKVQAVDAMIYVNSGGEVSLGEGAVVQNGKNSGSNNVVSGIHVAGGILTQNGGMIRDMEVLGSSNENPRAAAVYCENPGGSSGKFYFKSGQIYDNAIRGTSSSVGAAVVIGEDAFFEMSGGSVHGNRNNIDKPAPDKFGQVKGAGVYIYRGLAKVQGGAIYDNTSNIGSAIFYDDLQDKSALRGVILSGGQVSGNRLNSDVELEADGIYSPVYVNGPNFQLEGGGCNMSDRMYLTNTSNHITVSGDMKTSNRQYQVALNKGSGEGQFRKGSIIVAPDGSNQRDVTPYLSYFTVASNPYVLDIGQSSRPIATDSGIQEQHCLLLMQAVYLDGERGSDTADGSTPKTAVKTFSKAKKIGMSEGGPDWQDYYIIYVCGKTSNTADEVEWSMGTPAYMCRYTGFPVYGKDGVADKENRPYHGHLVEPQSDLTISSLRVYGRRSFDSTESNGESLFKIPANVKVILEEASGQKLVFGRNYNMGTYWGEDKLQANLSSRGGVFQIMPEGTLEMSAGRIVESAAAFGSAIYLGADENNGTKTGHLILDKSPSVSGTVYLDGKGTVSAAYIEPKISYRPSGKLSITMKNAFSGRKCVQYPSGSTLGSDVLEQYSFEDSIYAMYNVDYSAKEKNVIELAQRSALYLDGAKGNDSNNGTTPEQAFQTLEKLYQHISDQQQNGPLRNGAVVYIVDTVVIENGQSITLNNKKLQASNGAQASYEGSYTDANKTIEIDGQVFFKRYVQPKQFQVGGEFTGYNRPTMSDELIHVKDGASLTLNGIYLDGHSIDPISGDKLYETEGVTAKGPMVVVEGELLCGTSDYTSGSVMITTKTRFANNINEHKKTNEVGILDNTVITEGSSAGIEVLRNGICELSGTEFINLELDDAVAGGTDIYHNGEKLSIDTGVLFSGSVFLEGTGDKNNTSSSRYITVKKYGTPVLNDFQVLMRDPYKGRKVLGYPVSQTGPNETELGKYRLEERVKEFYYLSKKEGERYTITLAVPSAVYISGNGSDDPNNSAAGSNPANPVQSLERAYELLKTRGDNTISVVDTIQIDSEVDISGTRYIGQNGTLVALSSTDRVNIVRYVQPDIASGGNVSDELKKQGYDKADFTGPLLNVKEGGRLIVGDNVHIDGHRAAKNYDELPEVLKVSRESSSQAPLITVAEGAEVVLKQGVTLRDNDNQYTGDSIGTQASEIFNRGTVTVSGAIFTNNEAKKGIAVYQAGTFTIESGISTLADHRFYLAADKKGTDDKPIWEDYVLQIGEKIPDPLTFYVDMDHAAAGRDVIVFTDPEAYAPAAGADAEHKRFVPGNTVPDDLFLVEAVDDPSILELQDWKTLNVKVPTDIYLAVTRKGNIEGTTKLTAIREGENEMFSTPEYQITNKGKYAVKVSVNGMTDVSKSRAEITGNEMLLKPSEADVIGDNDLYLAIQGLDSTASGGFKSEEIALTDKKGATVLGQLDPDGIGSTGNIGTFGLTGRVGAGFVDKYKDPDFPITESIGYVQEHLDGSNPGGLSHAKAYFLLKYKVEIVR